MQLADDFWRLAHHDVSGKPRLNGRAAGLGLAAALLGELMWAGKITARDGRLCLHSAASGSTSPRKLGLSCGNM